MNEILGLRTYASREGHQEPANPHAAIPPGSEEPLQEGESFISCISFYLPVREHG